MVTQAWVIVCWILKQIQLRIIAMLSLTKEKIAIFDINQENLPVKANSQSEVLPELNDTESDNPEENEIRFKKKNTKPPVRLNNYYLCNALNVLVANPDPILFVYSEKLPINEQNLWRNAMDQEMKSLNQKKFGNLWNYQKMKRQYPANGYFE